MAQTTSMPPIDHPMFHSSRPYTRWWWFSGEIRRDAIDLQLNWVKAHGFGGVEIAWVYAQPGTPPEAGPKFLDAEWQELVNYTLQRCVKLGLGCDLTFGTLWPFGGTFVPEHFASRTFNGLSPKRITRSWEARYTDEPGLVMDHLNRRALDAYSSHLLDHGFTRFAQEYRTAFFMDSLEIDMEGLSTHTLPQRFEETFGYALTPFIEELDAHADVRFDYRLLISRMLLEELYIPYREMCHTAGAIARIQCHGALTDLLLAYGAADIPETEALLFDPEFSAIPASAAAYRGKPLVSSESFTCLYGWVPLGGDTPYLKQEHPQDVKVQADAQFASGMNHVLWHGMPFSTPDAPREFYASVHVGPDGGLADYIAPLNEYFTTISDAMRRGMTHTHIGVYLPLEDQWMRDRLPEELYKPSNEYFWELQETTFPENLLNHRPLWLSGGFFPECHVHDPASGSILCGEIVLPALYVDAQWMTWENLQHVHRLARDGGRIIMQRCPREPGHRTHDQYEAVASSLMTLTQDCTLPPSMIEAARPLEFWCRKDGSTYILFFAHPGTQGMRYPLEYQFYQKLPEVTVPVILNLDGFQKEVSLPFKAAGSVLITFDSSTDILEVTPYS